MRTQSAAIGLPTENTFTRVSSRHGRVRPSSTQPPHKSTTRRPSMVTATAAPSSPRLRKFSANASRTPAKCASQLPEISGLGTGRILSDGGGQGRPVQHQELVRSQLGYLQTKNAGL